ncbi:MAG TPA: hypothetical protein VG496_09710 [Myxococcales bacterium]|nr:hypothetical protein [Myxococcales bacterium]
MAQAPYTLDMLLLLALLAASPNGRAAPELLGGLGPLRPQVGAWVEYLVRSRGEPDVRARVAVVPPLITGRAWIEVATVGAQTLPFAVRVLLHAATGRMERAAVYALGQAPIELPVDDAQGANALVQRSRRVGSRTVIVPAGTFATTEVLVNDGTATTRVFRSDRVPLWGVVRAEGSGRTIELLRYGHGGARSVFPVVQGNGSESANE